MTDGRRARARELGVAPGVFETGTFNAITDVAGVLVGHATLIEGDAVRTGVTAILPHGGTLYRERVPAALHVGNGFGKLVGSTQVDEHGELETPILLTGTLSVWKVADALVGWMLEQSGEARMERIAAYPLGSMVRPEEIADLVRFPASPRSDMRMAP